MRLFLAYEPIKQNVCGREYTDHITRFPARLD